MNREDVLRYSSAGLGVALALAYSSLNVSAAGDHCKLGGTCGNGVGTCAAIYFQPGTSPANYYCACVSPGFVTPDSSCIS